LETELWGDLQGDTVKGDLIFKGGGDPFLVSERIWMLAQQLKKGGVTRILGKLKLDQEAFDSQRYGPGWENTTSDTTPPILPLSVNFSRDERGRIVRAPETLAIETIRAIFQEVGISVEGKEIKSGEPQKILTYSSPPLRDLVEDINKFSNNFMIEMLVKRFGEGSWPAATKRIQDFYQLIFGLGREKIMITDGSGLSKRNRLSARTLAIVLRGIWHDFEVGPELVSSLKVIGGEYWKQHIKDPNLTRRIRCKTGHLDDVDAACGYIQMPDGKLRVFAIILNGPCGDEDVWGQVSRWAN
jgi:D-alanyl-D-alanine carboxypeptidase/D-alanyl-D-alanine-endopeptidase (penicillin-binding protein 4)